MRFEEFKQVNIKVWNDYLSGLYKMISHGYIEPEENGLLLYPNIILFTETKEHFICELLGANRIFEGLNVKQHKETSTYKYLYQFDFEHEKNYGGSAFNFDGRNIGMKNLFISRETDVEALNKRFGFHKNWKSRIIRTGVEEGSLLSFGENFKSCFFDNSLFVNRMDEIYRAKHILHMIIVAKDYSKSNFAEEISNRLFPFDSSDGLYGAQFCEDYQTEAYLLSGQFTNTFLISGLRETTIGEFLNENPSLVKQALSSVDFLYERDFEWIEGNSDADEKTINPDLMLLRTDGFYDICDLKTPKLEMKSLTKGKHKRRRFYDYVEEGIAQLANYEEYFTFEENKRLAKSKYNVEVSNPNLYLIVGNYENLSNEEVREASRRLKSNFRIIDYDTLNALYLNKTTSITYYNVINSSKE